MVGFGAGFRVGSVVGSGTGFPVGANEETHDVAPAAEDWPEAHEVHADDALVEAYVPAAHNWQVEDEVAPVTLE